MTEKMTILYKYSDEELNAVREQFADNQIKIEELKERKKEVVKDYSDRIKMNENAQRELRQNIKAKAEYREMEVEAVNNFAKGVVEYFAVSGRMQGEMVHSRKMTPSERQLTIESKAS